MTQQLVEPASLHQVNARRWLVPAAVELRTKTSLPPEAGQQVDAVWHSSGQPSRVLRLMTEGSSPAQREPCPACGRFELAGGQQVSMRAESQCAAHTMRLLPVSLGAQMPFTSHPGETQGEQQQANGRPRADPESVSAPATSTA